METSKEYEFAYARPAVFAGTYAIPRAARKKRSYERLKRLLDVTAAAFGIALLSPLFLLVALLVKLDDPKGGVFFRQVRIGKNGRPFHMYKFRSMIADAEHVLGDLLARNEIEGKMFKIKDDPRITRVGRIIRRTSIDELPQLWNVLRGDMSLVGPRPSLPREVEQYSAFEKQRLTVLPGCTGLWQVSGRNGLSFREMVELDLYYIQNRSVAMDLLLILKTVKEMMFPSNAY